MLADFENILVKGRQLDPLPISNALKHGKLHVKHLTCDEAVDAFLKLKGHFICYSKVAGFFSLAILFSSVSKTIQALSSITFNLSLDGYGYNVWSKSAVYTDRLNDLLNIFAMSSMRTYMKERITQHRDHLLNFYAKHGSNNLASEHADRAAENVAYASHP
ncbi:unnamed protein product [Allacma fusca]|uniref:Uncharacterized protein n=1 Tax=Allacma fusca TaxID=39272 RepID=A0A8J2KCB6_9HEXA|nr:unnamed protein product [Allacma fusca]